MVKEYDVTKTTLKDDDKDDVRLKSTCDMMSKQGYRLITSALVPPSGKNKDHVIWLIWEK